MASYTITRQQQNRPAGGKSIPRDEAALLHDPLRWPGPFGESTRLAVPCLIAIPATVWAIYTLLG